jgi:hypothetical protein
MLEIITAFIIGFATMWLANRIDLSSKSSCPMKESMIDIAKTYPNNVKICNELKKYSFDKIKHGSLEYVEVIDHINRQQNDKTRK